MKAIVITSIFPPTEAIKKFAKNSEYKVYIVGDKKTPSDWTYPNTNYISVENQESLDYSLSKLLPYNHYCRKMLGYLEAIREGAEYICDTDDDNIPYENWMFPEFYGEYDTIPDDKGFINIYQLYTKQKIWPRGLPLKLINTNFELEISLEKKKVEVGVWQGLADDDPDVDAVYRLTNDIPCFFNEREPVVLGNRTVSPFNTQNTLIRKELFPLLYLPAYVTFRYTDILRGLIAQPIMWESGFKLGFIHATVIQKRNPHDYMKDFISEIPMYESCEKIIDLVSGSIHSGESIENNLFNAYYRLSEIEIIEKKELVNLESWLKDLNKIKWNSKTG